MIYRLAYYACLVFGIFFMAVILSDRFPHFFANPALAIFATCAFALLMIYRPRKSGADEDKAHD